MKGFHKYQLRILQKLMYSNGLSYSRMKPKLMEGSLFTFHLERLLKGGLIKKSGSKYMLTKTGKELAGRMDLGDTKIETQAKISVIMVCRRKVGKTFQYLLYTRLKSPFYNFQGFPTGKVKKGEDILEASKRELKEETGLIGEDPKLFGIFHYRIYDKQKILLEDKIFFAYKFEEPKGSMKSGPEGSYKWVNKNKVWEYLKRPVKEIKELFKDIDSKVPVFIEKKYTTEDF